MRTSYTSNWRLLALLGLQGLEGTPSMTVLEPLESDKLFAPTDAFFSRRDAGDCCCAWTLDAVLVRCASIPRACAENNNSREHRSAERCYRTSGEFATGLAVCSCPGTTFVTILPDVSVRRGAVVSAQVSFVCCCVRGRRVAQASSCSHALILRIRAARAAIPFRNKGESGCCGPL